MKTQTKLTTRLIKTVGHQFTLAIALCLGLTMTSSACEKHNGGEQKTTTNTIPELKELTISKIYWLDSSHRPPSEGLDEMAEKLKAEGNAHILLVHIEEDQTDQYYPFINNTDTAFLLKADGHPDVPVHAILGSITVGSEIHEVMLEVSTNEGSKMANGISYKLIPLNSNPTYKWKIEGDVALLNEFD